MDFFRVKWVIEQRGDSVRVRVYVQPRASRTEVVGQHGDALKIRVAAPPVDGAANVELVRHLAKRIGIPVSQLRVLSGATGRTKTVEIDGASSATVRQALLG